MTHAVPGFSAFTAATELLVTVSVFYVLYAAIWKGRFHGTLLGVTLAYEILFNISYMTYRLFTHIEPEGFHHSPFIVALLAGHGALSLLMFIGLVALAVAAFRWHGRGRNLFAEKRGLTAAFAVLWTVSILSGEAVFLLEYVGHY